MIQFSDTDRLEALAKLLQEAADYDEQEQVRAGVTRRSVLLFAGQGRWRMATRQDPVPPEFNGKYYACVIPPRLINKCSTYNSTQPLHDDTWDPNAGMRDHESALEALRGALDNLIARTA